MEEQSLLKKPAAIWPTVLIIVVAGLVGYFIGSSATGNDAADTQGNVSATLGDEEESAAMSAEGGSPPKDGQAASPEKKDGAMTSSDAILTIENQPAGKSVAIKNMNLAATAWVAIHDDRDGKPGDILGAKRYFATETSGTVPLLRATVAGKRYFAMVHKDNGNLAFEFKAGDAPLMNSAGEPVMAAFVAQ